MNRVLPLILLAIASLARGASVPTTSPTDLGPDVVILKELVTKYEPVPFDHKAHAMMAEMWDGCVTCHHRPPQVEAGTTQPVQQLQTNGGVKRQSDSETIPACKSCHAVAGEEVSLRMPNLKGAYHRQCLNCHREWAHENGCSACHQERDPNVSVATTMQHVPSVDDIVGRMHPPIPQPEEKVYTARFEPAVGRRVLFRHTEHTREYGIRCALCHRDDNCSRCHTNGTARETPIERQVLHPGRSWTDAHGPCAACHEQDACRTCHHAEDEPPPPAFTHAATGQLLDQDHADLKCAQCHTSYKSRVNLTCGGAECHAKREIAFPAERPGPTVTTQPVVTQLAVAPEDEATTQPTTRAVIKRIRR